MMKVQSEKTGFSLNGHALGASRTSENDYVSTPSLRNGKKSFLVFNNNKYIIVPTNNIAFFHIKYGATVIETFDRQEYSLDYSLDQIQELLSSMHFFRLNRQYLVNFSGIKEVEHYFARKLLVKLAIPAPEKLLVAKERAGNFLQWLENR